MAHFIHKQLGNKRGVAAYKIGECRTVCVECHLLIDNSYYKEYMRKQCEDDTTKLTYTSSRQDVSIYFSRKKIYIE